MKGRRLKRRKEEREEGREKQEGTNEWRKMEAINKGRMAGKKCKMKERQEGRPGVGRNKGKLGKGMMIEGMNK